MSIRTYRPGDEDSQVAIYNTAAAALPKFKPATVGEQLRRVRARDFDAESRLFAEEGGRVVGYAAWNANGRVSFPWCLPGHEQHAEPLFDAVLEAVRGHGVRRAFAAYRGDWAGVNEFFLRRGFRQAREMINYVVEFMDLPTPAARPSNAITPLWPEDVPAVLALYPQAHRAATAAALHDHLFKNPYFTADSVFTLRSRQDRTPLAVGVLITEPSYADPRAVDADMPCFRLGAFGTEGMTVKRLRGLFSFVARPDNALPGYGMDLIGHAATRLAEDDQIEVFAAQVPSDAPALAEFYRRTFRRQGAFPVLEVDLPAA